MIDLDVDSPEKVADVLDVAAQEYRESAGELEAAWQDKDAGRPWDMIAGELEGCADRIRNKMKP